MQRALRAGLLVVGILSIVFAIGFFLQAPWATSFWPVKAARLSNIFVSSILAAIGTPILWIALSGEIRAIAGGAINLILTNGAIAFAAYIFYRDGGPAALLPFSAISAAIAIVCLGLLIYSQRLKFQDNRSTPWAVRLSFAGFAIALLLTGGALITVRPNIFPWPLSPENSVFYGSIFLGAMCYFIYGLVYPCWSNAKGQLLGFLAYDLVLVVPFFRHFARGKPEMHLSLTVYTTVVSYSGLLAIFFLFLYQPTRLRIKKSMG